MKHPNALIAHRMWDAIACGDADALRSVLAPDFVWRATARGTPWQGLHQGVDTAIDMLARVGEATDVFDAALVDVLASDERVAVVFRVHIGIGAREVELEYLALGRVAGDTIREILTVPLDPAAIEAFWKAL
jgi:ketosteroid isomerase-like protein